ncbi:MAG: hypothetical protein ACUVX9_15630 [Anaerolineae bacterium]
MTTLVAQIAPQRSTQYAALAGALAPHELRLSPLGAEITSLDAVVLAGQAYLRLELRREPTETELAELGALAMTSAFFRYFERLGERDGPFLQPLDTRWAPAMPADLPEVRRYKGKTNELLTRFLCNIARYSSAFAHQPWGSLRVLDPLAGGGTTVFTALVLGAAAAGIDSSARVVESTASFLREYARGEGIAAQIKEERLRGVGRRWWFSLGKAIRLRCLLATGEIGAAPTLLAGFGRPHLIVGDLPYGIQHAGELEALLRQALHVWAGLLEPGGAMALAWDATRFPRERMLAQVANCTALLALNDSPYDLLAHRVDRVIKRRDVLVARKVG